MLLLLLSDAVLLLLVVVHGGVAVIVVVVAAAIEVEADVTAADVGAEDAEIVSSVVAAADRAAGVYVFRTRALQPPDGDADGTMPQEYILVSSDVSNSEETIKHRAGIFPGSSRRMQENLSRP